jgi:hypothetical protein
MGFEGWRAAVTAGLVASVVTGCGGGNYQGLAAPFVAPTTAPGALGIAPGTAVLSGTLAEFASGTPLSGFVVTVGTLPNAAGCLLSQSASANPCAVVASTIEIATTSATGTFSVPNLPVGTYMVTISNGTNAYATLHRTFAVAAGSNTLGTVKVAALSADEQALVADVNRQRAAVSVPLSFANLTVDEYAEEQARAEVASIVAGTSAFGDATESAFGNLISASPGDMYGWASVSALSPVAGDYVGADNSWFGEKPLCGAGGNWQTCAFSDATGHYINLSNTDDVWIGFAESSTSFNYQNAGTQEYAYAAFTPADQSGAAPASIHRTAAGVLHAGAH